MSEDKYITIQNLADHYLVSVSTIRAWIRTKKIPADAYLKIGSTFRFKLSEVDASLRIAEAKRLAEKMAEQDALASNPDQDL